MDVLKAAAVALSLGVTLSGCSTQNSADPTAAEVTSEAAVTEPAETAVTEEINYFEKCTAMLKEMPPAEILEKNPDINYPEFQKYTYYSTTAERDTNVNILLPKNYNEEKEYPVLYILHGYYDNEDWMARDTVHISVMLNNLIAAGEAKEMIVVCPYIYCNKDMPYCTGMDTQNTLNYDNFINDLTTDLMPYINENFSVSAGRENAAITGFSMGGRESLYIGVKCADTFGYVGSICSAPGLTEGSGYPWQLKENELTFTENPPYLIMISAAKNDGVVGMNPIKYRMILEKNENEVLWHQMAQTGHDASSVTPHLYNFMRMIFTEV